MDDELTKLIARFRALSPVERARVLRALLADLDSEEDATAPTAWLDEAARRHREILEGKVRGIPADQVFANLRKPAGN